VQGNVVGVGPKSKEGDLRRPPSPRTPGSLSCRAAILALLCSTASYGTRMMLLSMVTAARAKALPDRRASVFIVMLE
jgi:hypothetical protein